MSYTEYIEVFWIYHALKKRALSLHFNGYFPGEPGLAGVYWR